MKRLAVLAMIFAAVASACATAPTSANARAAATPMPPLTIYHLEGRRSERIVWLMEELGFPYELKFVRGNMSASLAQLREVNPAMPVAPTVFYGDQILVESGALMDIILNRHAPGKFIPPLESEDYAWHTIWMHYAEGSLFSRILADYRVWQIQPPTQKGRLVDAGGVIRYAEDFLGKHPYFGGAEFSAADIMMQFPLEYAFRINIVDKSGFPNINAWNAKVMARPAYQRMNAKAEPDGFLSPPQPLPDNARAPG